MGEGGVVGRQHLLHAGQRGSLSGHGTDVLAQDQHVDVAAELLRGGDGVAGCRLQRGGVVFCNNEDGHAHSTFASFFSFATSSATEPTLMPAERLAGSANFSVFSRGATSTPRSAVVSFSSGFFLAAMMFGSLT